MTLCNAETKQFVSGVCALTKLWSLTLKEVIFDGFSSCIEECASNSLVKYKMYQILMYYHCIEHFLVVDPDFT